MLKIVRPFVKKICVVCVQPVSDEFAALNKKHKVVDYCFTICKSDVTNAFSDDIIHTFEAGINALKFKPSGDRETLCQKLDLPQDKIIVLHVGHCSKGRYLEEMLTLDKEKHHCIVIASGMFDDENTINALKSGGIDVRFGFVENIEDFYNCADVYFFPTKSSEYVISVPLSVMEALSCSTPVVAYSSFKKLSMIKTNNSKAMTLIDDVKDLDLAIDKIVGIKSGESFLLNPKSWKEISDEILNEFAKITE